MRSQIVALFATILVLALVQAAPNGINRGLDNRSLEPRTFDKVWSALELLIYRLTHGGQYPPGYGQTPVTSTRTTAAATKTSKTSVAPASSATTTSASSTTVIVSSTSSTSSTVASTTVASSTTPVIVAPVATSTSKGFLYAKQTVGGSTVGCVISDGNWFIGGSCASYTQKIVDGISTFTTSKGPCSFTSEGVLTCAAGNTAANFVVDEAGILVYQSSGDFSADEVPPTNTREPIFIGSGKPIGLSLVFSATAIIPPVGTTTIASSSTAAQSSTAATSATSTSAAPYPTGTGLTVCSGKSLDSFPRSCSAAAVSSTDTCCVEAPGGHLLMTEFWNTGADSVGPNTTWTVHGLWPDNCDGTFEAYCDPARELTNVTEVLKAFGEQETLDYMNANWKSNTGNDESLWEHEFNKHGTCLSTLEPKCFNNFRPQQDALAYFRKTVAMHKTLGSYESLAAAGILPSLTQTYTLDQMQKALTAAHGFEVNVNCDGSVFDEIWYHYEAQGSIADGELIPAPLVGSKSTCPTTGIKYYPKYTTIPAPQPVGSVGGGTITNGGKVFIYAGPTTAYTPRTNYLTSTGKWFASGTPAGFTLGAVTGGSYTLTSSKGPCAVDAASKLFSCGAEITSPSEFIFAADGSITLGGSGVFSASQTPSGATQVSIYQNDANAVKVILVGIAQ